MEDTAAASPDGRWYRGVLGATLSGNSEQVHDTVDERQQFTRRIRRQVVGQGDTAGTLPKGKQLVAFDADRHREGVVNPPGDVLLLQVLGLALAADADTGGHHHCPP